MSEIIKAIAAATADVKKLGKNNRNEQAKYDYVSVDDFYAALGPIISQHGLVVFVDETSSVIEEREGAFGKKANWLISHYDITVEHVSGEVRGPFKRAITTQAFGAQSFAAALSYVEKYFLRSLLKVPTGDPDEVDAQAKAEVPVPLIREDLKIEFSNLLSDDQVANIDSKTKLLTKEDFNLWATKKVTQRNYLKAVEWLNTRLDSYDKNDAIDTYGDASQ